MFTILIWLAIAVMAYALWRVNRRPVRHSPTEVAAVLRSLLNGTTGAREWSYFMAVRIEDPQLESIRSRCVELWGRGPPAVGRGDTEPHPLTELGRRQASELLTQCESLIRTWRSRADAGH